MSKAVSAGAGGKEQRWHKEGVVAGAFTRRGAEKLDEALQTIVAHNASQTSRDKAVGAD